MFLPSVKTSCNNFIIFLWYSGRTCDTSETDNGDTIFWCKLHKQYYGILLLVNLSPLVTLEWILDVQEADDLWFGTAFLKFHCKIFLQFNTHQYLKRKQNLLCLYLFFINSWALNIFLMIFRSNTIITCIAINTGSN